MSIYIKPKDIGKTFFKTKQEAVKAFLKANRIKL